MSGILNIAKKLIGDKIVQYLPLAISKVRALHRSAGQGGQQPPITQTLALEDGTLIKSVLLTKTSGQATVIAPIRYLCAGYEVDLQHMITRATSSVRLPWRIKAVIPGFPDGAPALGYRAASKYSGLLISAAQGVTRRLNYSLVSPLGVATPFHTLNWEAPSSSVVFPLAVSGHTLLISEPQMRDAGVVDGVRRFIKVNTRNVYFAKNVGTGTNGAKSWALFFSYSVDGGATFIEVPNVLGKTVAETMNYTYDPNSYDPADETGLQYLGPLTNIGNSTVIGMCGFRWYQQRPGVIADMPVMLRSTDAGKTWSRTPLDSLFAWVGPLVSVLPDDYSNASTAARTEYANARYIDAYQIICKFSQIIPTGNNGVVVIGFKFIPSGLNDIVTWARSVYASGPYPDRFTETWVWRSMDNGVTFDEGNRVADSHTKGLPLGSGGLAAVVVHGLYSYLAISDDMGRTWTEHYIPVQYENAGEIFNENINLVVIVPLGAYSKNLNYSNYIGMSIPRPTLLEIPPVVDGLIQKDQVKIAVPLFSVDGYYTFVTADGGATWEKLEKISTLATSPQELLVANFREIFSLSETEHVAFPKLDENLGNPL